jgi:hypothetical protein
MATVEKQLAKYAKTARSGGDKEAQRIVIALEKVLPVLNEAGPRDRKPYDRGAADARAVLPARR